MKIFPLVALTLALCYFPSVSALESSTDFAFSRAMYGPWSVDELGNFSFDAKYRNSWWLHSGPDRVLDRFAEESLQAAANNVTYIAGLYYHAAPWDRLDFEYTHAVHHSGTVEPYTPSPIDETWWRKTMHEPAVAVANLSLYYPIWGLVWDIELYGHAAMLRFDYSYDLPAIHAFVKESGITVPSLDKNGGYLWLVGQGLLGDYHRWLEKRVYDMAKETEEAVHSINPNFSLGLLGFVDSWHHWAILSAFNSSTAPVTAWTEFTYGGYMIEHQGKTGEEGVGFFQRSFRERGLNGWVMPGLRPHNKLGKFMWDLGFATRHNGAFWIYQHNGDPFAHTNRETYVKMYKVFDRYVFFNGSNAYYLPTFQLYPGADVHPYVDPQGYISCLIYTHRLEIPLGFKIVSDSQNIEYVGENLSQKTLSGPNLTLEPEELPCIIYGLREEDLRATQALSLINEFRYILDGFAANGIDVPSFASEALGNAVSDFQDGNYEDAADGLLSVRNQTYNRGLDEVWPLVEEGFSDPRNSLIPLSVLRKFNAARSSLEIGQQRKGEIRFLEGIRALEGVPESGSTFLLLAFAVIGLLVHELSPAARS